MFEELRKKTFMKSLIWTVIVLIAGIALIGWKIADLFFLTDFKTLAPDEISNQFVKLELTENLGGYLEAYEKNTKTGSTRTTDVYYMILTGDENATDYRIMSLVVPPRYEKKLDQMAEDYYNWVAENYSDEALPEPFLLRGKIKELSSEDSRYFKNALTQLGFTTQEIDDSTLPYYIDFAYGSLSLNIFFAGGILLVIYGVGRIIKGSKGGYLKKFRQDMAEGGFNEAAIESDFASAKYFDKKGNFRGGRLMTYYTSGAEIRGIPNNKISWCYQNTVTHRTNGVKTGTTYNVVFFVEGRKKEITLPVDNEAIAQDILQRYSAMFPWIIAGYTDELKKLFNKSHAEFLQLRYNTCEHVAVEPGLENSGSYESSGVNPADPV